MSALHRVAIAAVLGGLCALPASGDPPVFTTASHALSPIDTLPTKEELIAALGANSLLRLREFALDPDQDFGVRLRAVRAMPHFCADQPAQCRSALLAVFADIAANPDAMAGYDVLRLRAAIESLGVARTGAPADLTLLLGFLSNQSRDIRYAAARAVREQCDAAALPTLDDRYGQETVNQVKIAIDAARNAIRACVQ